MGGVCRLCGFGECVVGFLFGEVLMCGKIGVVGKGARSVRSGVGVGWP